MIENNVKNCLKIGIDIGTKYNAFVWKINNRYDYDITVSNDDWVLTTSQLIKKIRLLILEHKYSNKNIKDNMIYINIEDINFFRITPLTKTLTLILGVILFNLAHIANVEVKLVNPSYTKKFRDFYKEQISEVLQIDYNRQQSHIFDAFAILEYVPKQQLKKYQSLFNED